MVNDENNSLFNFQLFYVEWSVYLIGDKNKWQTQMPSLLKQTPPIAHANSDMRFTSKEEALIFFFSLTPSSL